MKRRPPNLRRLIVVNVLKRLSTPLRSDLLSDGTLSKRYDIPIHHPIRLSDKITVKQEELFTAFQKATQQEAVPPVKDENGIELEAKVSVESDGSGTLEVGRHRFRFEHAVLHSSDVPRRVKFIKDRLNENTLTQRDCEKLKSLVSSNTTLSNDEILEIGAILDSSIETFSREFRGKLQFERIAKSDLLPDDIRYWDHLTAPLHDSSRLDDFIARELLSERNARLQKNPEKALQSIALTFSAPNLVPLPELREFTADDILPMVERLIDVDDHFAQTGAFEICADWIQRDERFGSAGERLLDRLFGDMSRLKSACEIFGTAFVIATEHLARHALLRRMPPFWRRLTAAAQASVIVRACGVSMSSHSDLLSWAMHISGKAYLTSTFLDMAEEPRWRPEWVMPHFLVADAFGRVNTAMRGLPEGAAPESWTTRVESARTSIEEQNLQILTSFPAITEGAKRGPIDLEPFLYLFEKFNDSPSPEHFMQLAPLIYTVGFPSQFLDNLHKLLERLQREVTGLDDSTNKAVVTLSTHIAVEGKDVSAANHVADLCLSKISGTKDPQSVIETIFRIVECSAADPVPESAYSTLAHRLERIATILAPESLDEFIDVLDSIKQVKPDVAPLLGRALASARLGLPPDVMS